MKSIKKIALIVVSVAGLAACASSPDKSDPYEGFNRVVYGFNSGLDRFLIKPIAQGYHYVTPSPVEAGVGNFFSNLGEIRNLANSGLQGKGNKTLLHTGRFLVNSTIGLLGFIDTAQYVGLEKTEGEDFGQTLGTWGVGSGPYLVLPFFGPSNFRDGIALPIDAYANPVSYVDHVPTRNTLYGTNIVDTRAQLLATEELLSGDRYIFIRDAYLQRRQFLINDGEVTDEFSGGLEEDKDF